MNFAYFDASCGASGDMILGALLDLGISPSIFRKKMEEIGLPVKIHIKETKRSSLRAVKVDVEVDRSKKSTRKWVDIKSLIEEIPFSRSVKKNSLAVFRRLFEAEARVHGHKIEKTHLHEAGADDAIIDIVGACFLAETLDIKDFLCSPINLGEGWIETSHGVLPVPPPAVAELTKSLPVYSAWVKEELVTPTGAAILSTLVRSFVSFPEMSYEQVGCGAGTRDFADFPNILRVFFGPIGNIAKEKKNIVIEANIDDMSPQILGGFIAKALRKGAKDVTLTPVVMKKNRLGTKLSVLCDLEKRDALIGSIFKETSSIGVRYFPVERQVLERRMKKVRVLGQEIAVKESSHEGETVNIQPEFDDCLKLSKKTDTPVKKILELALAEYFRVSEKKQKKSSSSSK